MGFMSSLVNIGSLTLQTAINKLGQDIIVAHTAARKISEMFMIMFTVFGQTMATYCGQNMGAGRIDRVKTGIKSALIYTCSWCVLTVLASYTIGDWLIYLVTGSNNENVIRNAVNYLKFDTVFYFVTAFMHTKKCDAGAWRTYNTACIKFSGNGWENYNCCDACSVAWICWCHCCRADSMVYYGNSTHYTDIKNDSGT